MAQLGILEGRVLSGARSRGLFGGTLASSRARAPIGPALFGDLSTTASQAAGRGRAADAQYARAKTAAIAAGLSAAAAEAIAVSAGSAAASGLAYDYTRAIQAALPPAPAAPVTSASALATQDQLRQYYADPVSDTSPAPLPVDNTPPPPPTVSPEDVLRSTYASPTPAPATSSNASVPSAKSFIVPVAALAAAYFFLKG